MSFTTIIFDFDGVMSDYDVPNRLSELSRISGLNTDTIFERIWASGFENAADSGKFADEASYLRAFNDQLEFELSRDEWIACRAAAMHHRADMHCLVSELGKSHALAMLTNNGPLTKTAFARLAPKSADLFGDKALFSYEFGTKKPDGEIFRRVATMLGSQPNQCIFIDDKPRNCDGASEVGMAAIVFKDINNLKHRLVQLDVVKSTT
jgi:HAD superfamily hydrolase (TIGR01509 family)